MRWGNNWGGLASPLLIGLLSCAPPPPPQLPCSCPACPTPGAPSPAPGGAAEATPAANPLAQQYAHAPALSVLRGEASYYGDALAGNPTASGERYDPRAFTAAHRTLPFGTIVRVVRPNRPEVAYVRITDRGPFGERRRILDVSRAAAEQLDMLRAGVIEVQVEVVALPPDR